MNRLEAILPEWTRCAWVSHAAKALWEPRISAIGEAWDEVEILSIGEGQRISALRFCTPDQLVALTVRMALKDLMVVPLGQAPISGSSYSSSGAQYMGGNFTYRVAITTPSSVVEWTEAWGNNDDVTMGRLLGFPGCCREFFRHVWVVENHVDTSWPMAMNSVANDEAIREGDVITIPANAPLESNILLRWSGVRAVPHLPCSFHCEPTQAMGVEMQDLMVTAGFSDEVWWMRELLGMPMEWSNLHGIAEIKTPLFTVSTRSDLVRSKYTIQVQSDEYPVCSATGLRFPYQLSDKNALTEGKSFAASITRFKEAQADQGDTVWTDNGFSSEKAMNEAHAVIRTVFLHDRKFHPEAYNDGRILDLGCGNGHLVISLMEGIPSEPCGIDTNGHALARAYAAAPDGHWEMGDIRDGNSWPGSAEQYDLVLFMPGRFDEWPEEDVEHVLNELRTLTKRVLLYCYDDHVREGGLRAIVDRHPILASWWGQGANILRESGVEAVVVTV